MGKRIKVLVADDSSFARSAVTYILQGDPDIEVIAQAQNGAEAVELTKTHRPDVVTMDVVMPKMDGLAALEQIMAECPTPVIMLSGLTAKGADSTIKALELGAIDCFLKMSVTKPAGSREEAVELISKIKAVVGVNINNLTRRPSSARSLETGKIAKRPHATQLDRVVVIASSAGGPPTLCDLMKELPGDISASILIVQHLGAGFTTSLAERLNQLAEIDVFEAGDGSEISPGVALLAPGDYHMIIGIGGRISINQGPKECNVRPAANVTMESVVRRYGSRTIGVVLTGMGNDGTRGTALIKEAGGIVIAEDTTTCRVPSMPSSVINAGQADKVLPLPKIGQEIARMCKTKRISVKG